MKFSVTHLLLLFPVLLLYVMLVNWWMTKNPSPSERERSLRLKRCYLELNIIQSRILDATSQLSDTKIPENVINQWLAGNLSSTHPESERLSYSPSLDPWGKPFRYIASDHYNEGVKVYSTGLDMTSLSSGNDPDDLSSWKTNAQWKWYGNEQKRKNAVRSWIIGGITVPVLYFTLIALSRVAKSNSPTNRRG